MGSANKKLLLIGPLPLEGQSSGGTKVSFELMVKFFESQEDYEVEVISTSRLAPRNKLKSVYFLFRSAVRVIVQVLRLRSYDIAILNFSATGIVPLGLLCIILLRLKRTKACLRVFGGDFSSWINRKGRISRGLILRLLSFCNCILLQTQYLCNEFDSKFRTYWFPTSRKSHSLKALPLPDPVLRDVVYVGFVNAEKGIDTLVSVAASFPTVNFHLVGEIQIPNFDENDYPSNCVWYGQVPHHEVREILLAAQVFMMASRRAGEGYPGSIIEAFNAGLAVVATPLPPLQELLGQGEFGLIAKGFSSLELVSCLERFVSNPSYLEDMQRRAFLRSADFELNSVHGKLKNFIETM